MREDLELVDEVLKGEVKAYEELVIKYETKIVSFIYNMIRNKENAEDLTQEVFIAAYKKLYSFKGEYKFSTWLFQIAKNKAIDFIRKHGRVQEVNMDFVCIASEEFTPEKYVEFKETKNNIESFIKTLKETDRQILILRYSRESLTFLDIALLLNMSESAVKKRYYKIYDSFERYKEAK